jgi:cellulose synthase/poly-beta-1,6-N-acetylglucosamine synthase-like glycosyltransferase
MQPPRVTIAVPVYNGERYLARTLDALLAQTFRDFELIITDNASTDRTAEIAQEYARREPRIRYFRAEAIVASSTTSTGALSWRAENISTGTLLTTCASRR